MAPVTQRICPACEGLSPASGAGCPHCGRPFRSERTRNLLLIVLLIVVSVTIRVLVELSG